MVRGKDIFEGLDLSGAGDLLDHPEDWTTGNEPMKEGQKQFLAGLITRTGMDEDTLLEALKRNDITVPDDGIGSLTKADASKLINSLRDGD